MGSIGIHHPSQSWKVVMGKRKSDGNVSREYARVSVFCRRSRSLELAFFFVRLCISILAFSEPDLPSLSRSPKAQRRLAIFYDCFAAICELDRFHLVHFINSCVSEQLNGVMKQLASSAFRQDCQLAGPDARHVFIISESSVGKGQISPQLFIETRKFGSRICTSSTAAPLMKVLAATTLVKGQPYHDLARCQSKSQREHRTSQ